MSLARDFSEFADQVNRDLDGIVNDMAASSAMAEQTRTDVARLKSDQHSILERVFEKLGSIDERLNLIQGGIAEDLKDLRHRVTKLEHNGTHPDEEATPPRARPALSR